MRLRYDTDELSDAHQRWEAALEMRAGHAEDYTRLASLKPSSPKHRAHLRKLMKEAMARWRVANKVVDDRRADCKELELRIVAARRGG